MLKPRALHCIPVPPPAHRPGARPPLLTWAPGFPCCPGGPGSPWGPCRTQSKGTEGGSRGQAGLPHPGAWAPRLGLSSFTPALAPEQAADEGAQMGTDGGPVAAGGPDQTLRWPRGAQCRAHFLVSTNTARTVARRAHERRTDHKTRWAEASQTPYPGRVGRAKNRRATRPLGRRRAH